MQVARVSASFKQGMMMLISIGVSWFPLDMAASNYTEYDPVLARFSRDESLWMQTGKSAHSHQENTPGAATRGTRGFSR
jgi:hypothetical protein